AGPYYVVESGLEAGEEVAINGVFKIDAAAQLQGKKSMMNPKGGKVSTGHHHGGMGDMKMKKNTPDTQDESGMNAGEDVSPKFREQIGDVVREYLAVKDALVNDDAAQASDLAKSFKSKLQIPDMTLLQGKAHISWMQALDLLTKDAAKLISAESLETKRKAFSALSDDLAHVVQVLGVSLANPLYLDFCPMANDNKGAYWLSADKVIRNPYFGSAMSTCGEIKEKY
ncbi:MAG: DUF3347 domain-containing protein, partial [Flavobacteriales bacterium]